jgi:ABC-type transporter Mla maintaining outer membrane lipid asymmetry ATPase subunit MlaF
MPDASDALIELRGISKDYRSLRPLRIHELRLARGESVAILGLDATAAEVFVNIITGATLPDAGDVRVLGRSTASIGTADEWLKWLEQFGLVSSRTILVDQFNVEQNLALSLSLEVEDMPSWLRTQVRTLASELHIPDAELTQPILAASAATQMRVRLGRALALTPDILLSEHPNAMLSPDDTLAFAADLSRIIANRGLTSVTITSDRTFASTVAKQILTLQPATGILKRSDGWRRFLGLAGNGT